MELISSMSHIADRLALMTGSTKIALLVAVVAPLVIGYIVSKKSGPSNLRHVSQPTGNSVMSPPRNDLLPPKTDPFTLDELRQFDGSDVNLPIYVSIKGTVFDVTHKRDVYGPPTGSYRLFAGKDASKAFGLSSLKAGDAVPDWSELDPKDMKTLEEWHAFFRKRYNVMGRVIDMPEAVKSHVWPKAK